MAGMPQADAADGLEAAGGVVENDGQEAGSEELICGRLLYVIDGDDVHGSLLRIELEAELLLNGSEQVRRGVGGFGLRQLRRMPVELRVIRRESGRPNI